MYMKFSRFNGIIFVLVIVLLVSSSPIKKENEQQKVSILEKNSKDISLKKDEQHWIDLILADIVSESGKKYCYMIASKTRLIIGKKTNSRLNTHSLINGKRKILKEKGINEADKLIDMLISANNISYKISIPKEATCQKNGFMNDSSCTYYAEEIGRAHV